jgi:small neutral amino acid transporter SnatA (MarC family)
VVIDPVSSVPLFLAMTDRYEPRQRHRAAWQAVLVAALIIAVFALFGQPILLYLGIRLPSLEAAGGLLLLVVVLDLLHGEALPTGPPEGARPSRIEAKSSENFRLTSGTWASLARLPTRTVAVGSAANVAP